MLGVSKVLVQSWEAGVRVPGAMARRVLDEVNREPEHWGAVYWAGDAERSAGGLRIVLLELDANG